VIFDDPFGQGTDRDDAGVRVITADGLGLLPQRLMKHAMIARRVSDGFIEDGEVGLIDIVVFVIIKRLEIDVGQQGTCWPDGFEQGLHNHIHAANNRPD